LSLEIRVGESYSRPSRLCAVRDEHGCAGSEVVHCQWVIILTGNGRDMSVGGRKRREMKERGSGKDKRTGIVGEGNDYEDGKQKGGTRGKGAQVERPYSTISCPGRS